MPVFTVQTSGCVYPNIVQRGIVNDLALYLPEKVGKIFVITTEDVWRLHGTALQAHWAEPNRARASDQHVLFFAGGESNKRLAAIESLAERMLEFGADRTSLVIGFGGGIVTDLSGFLAAIYMRGIPVLQIPTTLLAQVDAATGGKTGVNLLGGKNLIGSFHHPIAVLIDPDLLSTLPPREVRAGLFEVLKCGVIRDPVLFELLFSHSAEVLALTPGLIDEAICAAVRIKTEVVSADEREGDLRRILNFGHTIGHALEAEAGYTRFLHGEAVGWGMLAATDLASKLSLLNTEVADRIKQAICRYGPLPPAQDIPPNQLLERLAKDKKTLAGKVHFVLPTAIGKVEIVSGIADEIIRQAIVDTLQ